MLGRIFVGHAQIPARRQASSVGVGADRSFWVSRCFRPPGGGRPPPGGSLLEPVVCTPSGETGASERRLTFTLRTSLEMFGLRAEYLRGGFIVSRKAFVNGDLLCSFATTGVQRARREKREYPKGDLLAKQVTFVAMDLEAAGFRKSGASLRTGYFRVSGRYFQFARPFD
jgi:hypothetical protein